MYWVLQLLDDDDDDEIVRFPRQVRVRSDPFQDPGVSDAVFYSRFRFTRPVVLEIMQRIEVNEIQFSEDLYYVIVFPYLFLFYNCREIWCPLHCETIPFLRCCSC